MVWPELERVRSQLREDKLQIEFPDRLDFAHHLVLENPVARTIAGGLLDRDLVNWPKVGWPGAPAVDRFGRKTWLVGGNREGIKVVGVDQKLHEVKPVWAVAMYLLSEVEG